MLRALRRWWAHYVASIPKADVVDSIPESQWDRPDLLTPVSTTQRKAFNDLLRMIHAHLPPHEAQRLVRQGGKALTRGDEVDTALAEALVAEETKREAPYVGLIACDWKATDEVPWQVERLCEAHRISGPWKAPERDMEQVLQSLDVWLQGHDRRLLCFYPGDSVIAFAVKTDRVSLALALAEKLQLDISTPGKA